MGSRLIAVPFSEELLPLVQDFHCGDEAHERELADWLRLESVPLLARGTKAWLYVLDDRTIVGYGSLGKSAWRYPDSSSPRKAIGIIPAVAIQKRFWGLPEGPKEDRYSTQIIDHLVTESALLPGIEPLLGLFVHPSNQRALEFYRRHGFVTFSHSFTDKDTGTVYLSFVREIRR